MVPNLFERAFLIGCNMLLSLIISLIFTSLIIYDLGNITVSQLLICFLIGFYPVVNVAIISTLGACVVIDLILTAIKVDFRVTQLLSTAIEWSSKINVLPRSGK